YRSAKPGASVSAPSSRVAFPIGTSTMWRAGFDIFTVSVCSSTGSSVSPSERVSPACESVATHEPATAAAVNARGVAGCCCGTCRAASERTVTNATAAGRTIATLLTWGRLRAPQHYGGSCRRVPAASRVSGPQPAALRLRRRFVDVRRFENPLRRAPLGDADHRATDLFCGEDLARRKPSRQRHRRLEHDVERPVPTGARRDAVQRLDRAGAEDIARL